MAKKKKTRTPDDYDAKMFEAIQKSPRLRRKLKDPKVIALSRKISALLTLKHATLINPTTQVC